MTSFRPLQKAIVSKEQLAAFQNSKAYATITSYIETLNSAVVGVKLTDEHAQSQVRRLAVVSHQGTHRSEPLCGYLGNYGAHCSAGSRGGPGEGDASRGQRGVKVREPSIQDVL
jgi:Phosphotyrosyl phosphate activator (PTPA) protein